VALGHCLKSALDYFFGTADRELWLGDKECEKERVEAGYFTRLVVALKPRLPGIGRGACCLWIVVETCLG